jgi:hypothetical protein
VATDRVREPGTKFEQSAGFRVADAERQVIETLRGAPLVAPTRRGAEGDSTSVPRLDSKTLQVAARLLVALCRLRIIDGGRPAAALSTRVAGSAGAVVILFLVGWLPAMSWVSSKVAAEIGGCVFLIMLTGLGVTVVVGARRRSRRFSLALAVQGGDAKEAVKAFVRPIDRRFHRELRLAVRFNHPGLAASLTAEINALIELAEALDSVDGRGVARALWLDARRIPPVPGVNDRWRVGLAAMSWLLGLPLTHEAARQVAFDDYLRRMARDLSALAEAARLADLQQEQGHG